MNPTKAWLIGTVGIVLVASNSAVVGQTINLMCSGTVYQYEPNRMEGSATGAATIDLENGRIGTPVGDFHITRVEETSVTFDDPGRELVVFGKLDRMTGRMTVFWRRPEEEAKMQAHLTSNSSMYAELSCAATKRLF